MNETSEISIKMRLKMKFLAAAVAANAILMCTNKDQNKDTAAQ